MLRDLQQAPGPSHGAEMASRLEREGYLVLACPERLWERIEQLWRAAELFFAMPTAHRRRNTLPEHDGFHAIGEEYSDRPDRPDLAESFWARLLHADATPRFPDHEGRRMHRAALAACEQLEAFLTPLTEALSRHYAERWTPDLAFRCHLASHLQFNRYEPNAQTRELLTDSHEDGLYLTLLYADAPGLEIRAPDSVWRPVQPRSGELIAMPGEIFSLLCGYRVRPLFHRVRNHPEVGRRFAMMYFANPNPAPGFRPWIANTSNAGVDIIERAVRNPTRYGLPPLPRMPALPPQPVG